MIGVELDAGLGLAVTVGRLVHHVYLLLAADAREVAVVADTNEQATAVGIGKGGHGTRQLAGIGDTVLEVLLLVLALANQAEKKSSIVHVNCDFSTIYADKGFPVLRCLCRRFA